MFLYEIFQACGLRDMFVRLVTRLPEYIQRRLGLVPIRVPAK